MFKSKKATEASTETMQQFAVCIPGGITPMQISENLNKWCVEHDCYPLSFSVKDNWIFAVVRRNPVD